MSKVTLRTKTIGKGMSSLFLDIYPPVRNPDTGKKQRKYYLKLYLYKKPKDEIERFHNSETKELARTIAAKRQLDVQSLRFNFLSQRMLKGNFVEYFEAEKKKRSNISNLENWRMAIAYFKDFAGESVLFPELNETFSEEFADYLLSSPSVGSRGRKIGTNTAVAYFAKYRATLKQAFKDGYLTVNLYEVIDAISPADTHREFLFLDEVQKLVDTPCDSDVVKRAALFSSLTGFRFSDCNTLDWSELRGSKGNYNIQFSTDKTGSAEFLPISDQAVALLGLPGEGKVFKGLEYKLVVKTLPIWLKVAGISKHITFHCFRHTFATLQLLYGTDIVTVSKMLGHKNLQTTMIYVKIVDKLKREASDRIKLEIGMDWIQMREAI